MASIRTDKSILAVDDELDILNLIKQSLDMNGFKVCTFTDALAALEHFKSNSRYYDIVISDIRMPGMNGYEFVKHVKNTNLFHKQDFNRLTEEQRQKLVNHHGQVLMIEQDG
jgi:CheY-like chemotaxis protein